MATISRVQFLPADQQELAGLDIPLPIGHGQTNSQPRTVADMLSLLEPFPGMKVLDVGAGSGWTTALLGHLTGSGGKVIGVELESELADIADKTVAALNMPWAEVRRADRGVLGAPADGPFDRILVSAESREMRVELFDQLGTDGILVIPVAGTMIKATRSGNDDPVITEHGRYRFVPLR